MSTPSGPASVITDAIDTALTAAATISDPLERASALEDATANIPALQHALRRARAAAITEAMTTRTAIDVAQQLGISRSRLYKILDITERPSPTVNP